MCGIFTIKDGVNKHNGEPNYDLFLLALKSTAKRLYPNYANVDWSGNAGEEKVIDIKNEFLNSLNQDEKKKLISAIKENPKIADSLGIKIINE